MPATTDPVARSGSSAPAAEHPDLVATTARTAATLALLAATAPLNAAVTAAVLLARRPAPRVRADRPRTVLITGGKMTKALQLARSFHLAGHRVVLVETARYRLTGHRFSRAVDAFHVVPAPDAPGYAAALADVVRREGVDVVVPVTAPAASVPEADVAATLGVEVVHADPETIRMLDDKHAFCTAAAELGLPSPEVHRITDPGQVPRTDRRFVLKSIPYDPVHRLDLRPATPEHARTLPISADTPWVLQEFLPGTEWCTHSTVRDGEVRLHCTCRSSAFQLNYEHVEHPAVEDWVRRFVAAHRVTGQVSLDFIETPDGTVRAIECNPRTHSAITQFGDDPRVAAAYLGEATGTVTPTGRPTYWLYHELWRLVTGARTPREVARTLWRGRDAILSRWDPLPFFMVHHVQIPSLLARNLVAGRPWVKIDFNIGKLVEPGGD